MSIWTHAGHRLEKNQIHGHLFAPDRAEFSNPQTTINGAISDSAKLRDNNPTAFLTNLIWNTHGQHQYFQFVPRDIQKIGKTLSQDPNTQIFVITGAWLVPLSRACNGSAEILSEARRL